MFALSIQRTVDKCGIPLRPAIYNREILFFQAASLHQQAKSAGNGRLLCDKNKAARLAIQPIYDRYLAARGDFECEERPQLMQ